MGFAANQARALMLIARKSDLELQGMFIEQNRMTLASLISNAFNARSRLEPGSQALLEIEAQIRELQNRDKTLEMEMKRIEKQQEAAAKSIEAVDKLIDKNIEMSFGRMGK